MKTLGRYTHIGNNPWHQEARNRAFDAEDAKLVDLEYAGDYMVIECDCGGAGWYKMTILTHKCDTCGAIYSAHLDRWKMVF